MSQETLIGDNKKGLKFYKEIIKKFKNNIKLNGYLLLKLELISLCKLINY